jgi:hypothetical protein
MKHSSFIPQSEPQAEMVMALQLRLQLRLLLEQRMLLVRVLKVQTDYILHQELQTVLALVIHRLQLSLLSFVLQTVLDLVHPTTRFYIRILELLKVLVRQQLAMKPLDCTPHLERQLAKGLVALVPQSFIPIFVPQVHQVERQLETKQLACTQLQETQLVLALARRARMNSRFFIEHLYLLEHQVKQQLVYTLHQELLLVLVLPQLEILQLACIQHQELQPAME